MKAKKFRENEDAMDATMYIAEQNPDGIFACTAKKILDLVECQIRVGEEPGVGVEFEVSTDANSEYV